MFTSLLMDCIINKTETSKEKEKKNNEYKVNEQNIISMQPKPSKEVKWIIGYDYLKLN